MKTAKEILDKYLENYPWIHGGRENAIKAMNEYAGQFIQSAIDHTEKKSSVPLINKLP